MKQRRNFNALVSGQSQMNASRYARLMALAATDIALDLPLSIFLFWSNIRPGFQPWVSWSDTHYNFSLVS
jgi:pheromone a factor receptor